MPFPNTATQFKAGNAGRPPGRSVGDRLKDLLQSTELYGSPIAGGHQVADLIAEAIITATLKGKDRFAQILLERTEGKVKDSLEHSGEVTIRVEYADLEPDAHATLDLPADAPPPPEGG